MGDGLGVNQGRDSSAGVSTVYLEAACLSRWRRRHGRVACGSGLTTECPESI
jgi:hypothetical protein